MRRLLFALCLTGLTFTLFHCGDDTVEPPPPEPISQADIVKADSIAGAWFQSLYDTLLAIGDLSGAEFRDVRFDAARTGFQEALALEPANELGHIGLAIVELLEVNYSDALWAFVDSVEAWTGGGNTAVPLPPMPDFSANRHRTVIGNQFQLMVEMPMVTIARVTAAPENVTFDNLQTIIATDIIPKVSNAIDHMNAAARQDTAEIRLCYPQDGFNECLRFDNAELLVFTAGFYALRSALYSATAYDIDLLGPDGTYGWVDGLNEVEDPYGYYSYCCEYVVVTAGTFDDLYLTCYEFQTLPEAIADSILVRVLHHNLENRPDFLRLRNGGAPLRNAHSDMLTAFGKLEEAAAFVRDPGRGETEENVIKLADLTDFDSGIASDPDKPNFMSDWTRLEDAIQFGEDLLSGPYSFDEEIRPGTPYSWRVDLSRLFLDPVGDWNDMLPYHRWNLPSGPWVQLVDSYTYDWDNGGLDFWFYAWDGSMCVWADYQNIGWIHEIRKRWEIGTEDILVLLDGPRGNPIDPNTTFPYFRDYTLNGLFPDMTTHDDWQQLIDLLR